MSISCGPETVKLYYADTAPLADGALFERLLAGVSARRREKLAGMTHPGARWQSLAAELLLKQALTEAGMDYAGMTVKTGVRGKPYFEDGPFFSLSHTEGLALCALSPFPAGCDAERIRSVNPKIAERFFTLEEQENIALAANGEEAFFRTWTLKESTIKMTGLGLGQPLDGFSVGITREPPAMTFPEDAGVRLFEAALPRGYRLACCVQTEKACRFELNKTDLAML